MKLNDVFASEGLLFKYFKDYEIREGQYKMAEFVEECINKNKSCAIEGSTGVGKSFAYLIPLILSGKKAIISTSNKSLQDQLSNKDLPSLEKILKLKLNWTVLKGKTNYFCHQQFKINQDDIEKYFIDKEGMDKAEAKLEIKSILDWADKTEDGDVEYYPKELPLRVKEMITCSSKVTHDKDSIYKELCFAVKAKNACVDSNIILVNHMLLVLDMVLRKETQGKVKLLPDTDVVIVDEAHTLERYASMAFSDEISWFSLYHLLNWSIVKNNVPQKLIGKTLSEFKENLSQYLPDKRDKYYEQKEFEKFDDFNETIRNVIEIIDIVDSKNKTASSEKTFMKIKEIIHEGENFISRLKTFSKKDRNTIKWSEARDGFKNEPIIKLKSVPLNVSEILKKELFNKGIIICTSATLTINKSFDFFKYQIGMPTESKELIVNSSFNFKKNSLIYISTGQYQQHKEIEELLSYSKGRALVLFTSYKDMQYFYDMVDIPYPKMIQNFNISRIKLLDDFKKTPNAVLFATKSFWEGIDIKGDDLIMLIIHKLPFETPSDLVYMSKAKKIDEEFGDGKHWIKLTIPDMCLKLKQGVGRLIRGMNDIGVIAILDSRVGYKNYGKMVLNTLPDAHRTQKLDNVQKFYKKQNR